MQSFTFHEPSVKRGSSGRDSRHVCWHWDWPTSATLEVCKNSFTFRDFRCCCRKTCISNAEIAFSSGADLQGPPVRCQLGNVCMTDGAKIRNLIAGFSSIAFVIRWSVTPRALCRHRCSFICLAIGLLDDSLGLRNWLSKVQHARKLYQNPGTCPHVLVFVFFMLFRPCELLQDWSTAAKFRQDTDEIVSLRNAHESVWPSKTRVWGFPNSKATNSLYRAWTL